MSYIHTSYTIHSGTFGWSGLDLFTNSFGTWTIYPDLKPSRDPLSFCACMVDLNAFFFAVPVMSSTIKMFHTETSVPKYLWTYSMPSNLSSYKTPLHVFKMFSFICLLYVVLPERTISSKMRTCLEKTDVSTTSGLKEVSITCQCFGNLNWPANPSRAALCLLLEKFP